MESIIKLERNNKIKINPNLLIELRAKAGKIRGKHTSKILSYNLRQAAKELRNNPNIIIKKSR